MKSPVRPELPTAAVRSSPATLAAVDHSASFLNRPQSTYKSGEVVQTSGATSLGNLSPNAFERESAIQQPIDVSEIT